MRKIGGLYHWRVGPIGGSFYISRKHKPAPARPLWPVAAMVAIATACTNTAPAKPQEVTFALVHYDAGQRYVDDYGLTMSDCVNAMADGRGNVCEAEGR